MHSQAPLLWQLLKPGRYRSPTAFNPAFLQAMEHMAAGEYRAALPPLSAALSHSDQQDEAYPRYLSQQGLALVLSGQRHGINLCRQAACEADTCYNLAIAAWYLGQRKQALQARERGLRLDPTHPGLLQLREQMGARRPPAIHFLDRGNPLNRFLGKMNRQRRQKVG